MASRALVCINALDCTSVLDDLRNVAGVCEVHSSKGMYGAVALVQAASITELREVVLPGIRGVRNVKSTLTLAILEG